MSPKSTSMNPKILNYRTVIFALAFVFGVVFSIPSLTQSGWGSKITLGLDLQGGLHMLLGIKAEEAVASKVKSHASSIKYYAESKRIIIDELKTLEKGVSFELLDMDEAPKIKEFLDGLQGVDVRQDGSHYILTMSDAELLRIKENALLQAIDTIRNRLNQYGLAEPAVSKQGEDKILVEVPGIKTREEEQRVRALIGKAAHLEMMAVDEQRADRVYTMSEPEALQFGDVILPDIYQEDVKYLLKEIPILDGSMLVDARVGFDKNNQPVINFTLDGQGGEIFGDFSGKNVGNRMAVVLDGKVYSAPVIRERIGGGSGQISGQFSPQEASDLAIALRSGALPAPVVMLEKRSVGPSLGADSIQASLVALSSGFVLVVAFMMWYYGLAGVIANVAVVVNLFLIIAVMALFGATLTLPGMAGIVLTVGMAVDANVIISERIREFLRAGDSVKKAIHDGYANAARAILDANITTLIAAVILYAYGTGPIKGFAVTISIGILASMLTAILGTHGLYDTFLKTIERSRNYRLWFGMKQGA